jgi:hypothetical protein
VALTMYQDSAGTTAVSSPDQPIGILIDSSIPNTLGANVIGDSGFDGGWFFLGPSCTITGGVGVAASAVKDSGWYKTAAISIGTLYEATYTIVTCSGGGFAVGFATAGYCAQASTPGTYTCRFVASTTTIGITTTVAGTTGTVDNFTVRAVAGYHAIQSGATGLKPVLRLSPNGGWYLQRDLSDDNLVATFPAPLATGTCVHYRADELLTLKDENLTITGATNFNSPAYDYGRIILANPSNKDAQIVKWLDSKRGVAPKGLGPELVANGDFSNGTTGWTTYLNCSIAVEGGQLKVLQTSPPAWSGAYCLVSGLSAGKTYLLRLDGYFILGGYYIAIRATPGSGTGQVFLTPLLTASSKITQFFVATQSSLYIEVQPYYAVVGNGCYLDNISVREVIA